MRFRVALMVALASAAVLIGSSLIAVRAEPPEAAQEEPEPQILEGPVILVAP